MLQACDSMLEQLSLYVDGLLTEDERRRVEAHVATCDGCQRTLKEWWQVALVLAEIPEAEPPVELRTRILAATTRRPVWHERPLPQIRPVWLWAPTVAVVLLIALLIAPLFETPSKSEQPTVTVEPAPLEAKPPVASNEPLLSAPPVTQPAPKMDLRTAQAKPRWVARTRLSRLASPDTSQMDRIEVAKEAPVPDVIETLPGISMEPTPEQKQPDLIAKAPETPGLIANKSDQTDPWAHIRAQLKRDTRNDRLADLRQRNVSRRRLEIPIVSIRF